MSRILKMFVAARRHVQSTIPSNASQAALLTLVLLLSRCASAADEAKDDRPNILFIFADDQAFHTIAAL